MIKSITVKKNINKQYIIFIIALSAEINLLQILHFYIILILQIHFYELKKVHKNVSVILKISAFSEGLLLLLLLGSW